MYKNTNNAAVVAGSVIGIIVLIVIILIVILSCLKKRRYADFVSFIVPTKQKYNFRSKKENKQVPQSNGHHNPSFSSNGHSATGTIPQQMSCKFS